MFIFDGFSLRNLGCISRHAMGLPTGSTSARDPSRALLIFLAQVDRFVTLQIFSFLLGLPEVVVPALVLEHYDVAPEVAVLRNTGHSVVLTMQPFKYGQSAPYTMVPSTL